MHECKQEGKIDIMYDTMQKHQANNEKRLDKIDCKLELVLSLKYQIIGGILLSAFLAPLIVAWASK